MVCAMAAPEEQRNFKLGWSRSGDAPTRPSPVGATGRATKRSMPASLMLVVGSETTPGAYRRRPWPVPTKRPVFSPTDQQWERVSELFPEQKPGLGRPRRDDRQVLGGILWVMDTGASWRELPEEEFGPNSTAHGRYRKWLKEGLWSRIVEALGR